MKNKVAKPHLYNVVLLFMANRPSVLNYTTRFQVLAVYITFVASRGRL